jgi:radical SAM superfamily enzyme
LTKSKLKPTVILVSDRTLSADYKVLFEGIFATMQTTKVPEIAMRNFVAPPVKTDANGRASAAVLGLRRVESSLLKNTPLTSDDIVCTTPEKLDSLLGPWVKIVAISSSDPLGGGMSNTTTTNFWDGELYTSYWTRRMTDQLAPAKDKYNFKIVAGGAGAWQWSLNRDKARKQGIDVIFEGYFEELGPQFFMDIIEGRPVTDHVKYEKTAAGLVCPISNASTLGIIELSRGCGRGCNFCTMATRKMEHLPVETIVSDLQTNVSAGIRSVVSGSEDFFRYGAKGTKPDFEKLASLLEQMRKVKGLSFMQIDHGNVTSVLQLTDAQLSEIRTLLTWEKESNYLWVNMGVESANGHLVAANCAGKIAPFSPDDWEFMVREAAEKMTRNGFFSVFSVILGLPGETPDDIERTLKLVKYLGTQHAVIFPIFYEPLHIDDINAGNKFTISKMHRAHLELYSTCYEINFKGVPKLFMDNQRAGGVSWFKRNLMQALGKTEVYAWRNAFKTIGKEIDARGTSSKEQKNVG